MKTKSKRPATGSKRRARTLAYPLEFRLRMVQLFLEEQYSTGLLREQFGVSAHSIQRWVKAYRRRGAEGLTPKRPLGGKRRVAEEVRQQMMEVKKDHPEYGPRRIADVLKRFFLMRTSPSTVHKTLAERGLVEKARLKRVRTPPSPVSSSGPSQPAVAKRHYDLSLSRPQRVGTALTSRSLQRPVIQRNRKKLLIAVAASLVVLGL